MKKLHILKNSKVEPWEIKELFASVGWEDEASLSESTLDTAFNLAYCNFVARNANGKLIGVIRASFDGMYVVLWNLVIHPTYEGKGLGSELFKKMVVEMRERGHDWIVGLALKEREDFYAKHGLLPVRNLTVISTYHRL